MEECPERQHLSLLVKLSDQFVEKMVVWVLQIAHEAQFQVFRKHNSPNALSEIETLMICTQTNQSINNSEWAPRLLTCIM